MSAAASLREFMGYSVEGFSPSRLNAARSSHDLTRGEFNEAAWMDRFKPEPCVDSLFWSLPAAKEAVELARRDGWKRVRVRDVVRHGEAS